MDFIRVLSGVTKPLRAYVESSKVCLNGLFGRGRHSGNEWSFLALTWFKKGVDVIRVF